MADDSQRIKEFGRQLIDLQRRLHLFTLALVHNGADADDILQNTNRVLWEKCDDFQPGTNFKAWAFQVAAYEIRTFRKKERRSVGLSDEVIERLVVDADRELEGGEDRPKALRDCMDRLSEPDRDLISRRYLTGASVHELAATLDRSEKSVYNSLQRIRARLLDCINRRLDREKRP